MQAPIGDAGTDLHVLILPSEEFVPEEDHLAGIFQHHQALALRERGLQVGIISISQAYSIPMFVRAALLRLAGRHANNRLDAVSLSDIGRLARDKLARPNKFIRHDVVDGFPVLRTEGFYYLPPSPSTNHWGWVRAGAVAFEEYSRRFGKPDIIHAHNLNPAGLLAERISRRSGIPYVVTEHSSFFQRGLVPHALYPRLRRAASSAGVMAAVSPNLGAVVTRELKLRGEPRYIPNVLAPQFLAPLSSAPPPGNGFVFLSIGNFIPEKGHAFLLKAFARAFAGARDVKLRIGGDGDADASLRRLAADLGIADRVTFLGRLSPEAVAAQMDACNAFVLPSLTETFGVVVIEALARGKPVIATICGGPESIVTPADGVLVTPGDVGSLESALKSMRSHVDAYEAEDLRDRAIARFGPAEIARRLTDVYAEVLKGA